MSSLKWGLGIDLGTSTTRTAVFRDNDCEIIPHERGEFMPSFVAFTPNGRLVGARAQRHASSDAQNTIHGALRFLGRDYDDLHVQNLIPCVPFTVCESGAEPAFQVTCRNTVETVTVIEVLAMILSRVKKDAENYLGVSSSQMKAIITVPSQFTLRQRQAVHEAAYIAGLDAPRLISSAVTTCLDYATSYRPKCGTVILIVDFGGGTLDLALVNIEEDIIAVKAVGGNTIFGGVDIDERLQLLAFEAFAKETGDTRPLDDPGARRRLLEACILAKHQLSSYPVCSIHLDSHSVGRDFAWTPRRLELEELCAESMQAGMEDIRAVLGDRCLDDIDMVLLAGGSSQIPFFKNSLTELLPGKTIIEHLTCKNTVARGAAIQATMSFGEISSPIAGTLLDVAPLSIGVKHTDRIWPIIGKNSSIPRREMKYFTSSDMAPGKVGETRIYTQGFDISFYEEQSPALEPTLVATYTFFSQSKYEDFANIEIGLDADVTNSMYVTAIASFSDDRPNLREGPFKIVAPNACSILDLVALKHKQEYLDQGETCIEPGLPTSSPTSSPTSLPTSLPTRDEAQEYILKFLGRLDIDPHQDEQVSRMIDTAKEFQRWLRLVRRFSPENCNEKLEHVKWLERNVPIKPKDVPQKRSSTQKYRAPFVSSQDSEDEKELFTVLSNESGTCVDHVTEGSIAGANGAMSEAPQDKSEILLAENMTSTSESNVSVSAPLTSSSRSKSDFIAVDDEATYQKDTPDPAAESMRTLDPVVESMDMPNAVIERVDTPNSIEASMSRFFIEAQHRHQFSDSDFVIISSYLSSLGYRHWSATPRLYTVLRLIDELDSFDLFTERGLTDIFFPFPQRSLPTALSPTAQSKFLDQQDRVLSKTLLFERDEHRRHVHFGKGELGHFQVVGKLGIGAHGQVEKVISTVTHLEYARKSFRRQRGVTKDAIESFLIELKVLKRVHHTHCVELVQSYTDPKFFVLLMLPVAECNLQEYYELVPSSPDNLSLLRSFLGCLSSALQYIHSIKVRHRDIKPHNILVKNDRVYLTDFGIALDWQHLTRSTTTADSGKTWVYAAPEVARYEKRNTAADVWSLGCVFFEIATVVKSSTITGLRAFFDSKSGNHRFYANIANFSRWAATLRGKFSSKDDIIFKWVRAMLEENPEDRPTAAELFEDIVSETYAQKIPFCGSCCLEVMDASSVEGDGEDEDDPWSQVAELSL